MSGDATGLIVVKAFGDLVIALGALGRAPAAVRDRHRLLLGAHLVPLFDAIGVPVAHAVIDHGADGVPACFDARRAGIAAALASTWRLRRAIGSAARAQGLDRLLFDRAGPRERVLAAGLPAAALPAAPNIYAAYAAALGGDPVPAPRAPALSPGAGVGIFPGSRVAAKTLPEPVVRAAIDAVAARGLAPRLMLLAGERPDLEASGLAHAVIPRSFAAMVDAVAGCAAVIAADSMPAHVAELRGVPVHVLSPVDNRYWLPHSAFALARWSLFGTDIAAATAPMLAGSQGASREGNP